MNTYDFDLLISGASYDDEQLEEKLFNAGCDDATLFFRNAIAYLTFSREAESFQDAIVSAITDVEKTGLIVKRVMPDDIVSAAEIGRRLDKSREYIRKLITQEKGPGGFPCPVTEISTKSPLWSWLDVVEWLIHHDLINDDSVLLNAKAIVLVNSTLPILQHADLQDRQVGLLESLKLRVA